MFKAELIRNKGPWKSIDDLEIAVAEYIDWFNHRRLHGEIGLVPPVEFEVQHYRHNLAATTVPRQFRVSTVSGTRHILQDSNRSGIKPGALQVGQVMGRWAAWWAMTTWRFGGFSLSRCRLQPTLAWLTARGPLTLTGRWRSARHSYPGHRGGRPYVLVARSR